MSREPVSAARDQNARFLPSAATQPTMHPTLLAPPTGGEPMGRSPLLPLRAVPARLHGQRSTHQAIAIVPPLPVLASGGGPGDPLYVPGRATYQGHEAPDNGAPRIIGTCKPLHHNKVEAQEGEMKKKRNRLVQNHCRSKKDFAF